MSILRFDCTNGGAKWCYGCYTMTPNPLGDYVRHEDHEAEMRGQDCLNRRHLQDFAEEIERLRTALSDSALERLELLGRGGRLEAELAALREWRPMETAPKDGAEILGWRADAGVMMVKWTAPDYFLHDRELAEVSRESAEQEDWFSFDIMGGFRLEGDLAPTRWMPLPPEPDA